MKHSILLFLFAGILFFPAAYAMTPYPIPNETNAKRSTTQIVLKGEIREGGYEEFKEKYSTLYFPETEDDISAYLPVSDPYLAKFLNKDGEIIIDGETINMKDISSYEQLKDLNLTPLEDAENEIIATTRATVPLIYNHWGGTPVILTVGKSTEIGQRKIGVDKRGLESNMPAFINARFDIVFRKRGFLNAWYNH